ncbi:MAG: anti-sigma B factor antagonist [Verrucomicrobiales bacterium]|jgi:anti-sigma B factor antagonist
MFEFSQTSATGLRILVETLTLEAANTAEFKTELDKHCPATLDEVVVDLTAVEMIDSSGIGALLSVHKRLTEGNQVRLLNVHATVLSVIELLRLHQVFKMEWDTEKAGATTA